jgi:phosphate transport system protein
MTRVAFHQQLDELKGDILRLGGLVEDAIRQAVQSLADKDIDLAAKVIEGDDVIDELRNSIEEKCVELIATQQPMAIDLRRLFAGIKIVTNLERMADEAVNIAEVTKAIADKPLLKPLIDIPRMSDISQRMVRESLDAFVNRDIDLAKKVCGDDIEVDGLYEQIFRELLVFMMEDPRTITRATHLLLVARHLERMADHATNIGEIVIYTVTGKIVRTSQMVFDEKS